jgi:prolyl-tRNA synthetase
LKGVPVRVALGLRDLENNVVEIARRDTKEKKTVSIDGLGEYIKNLLEEIQQYIFNKALNFRNENIAKPIAGMNLYNCWMRKQVLLLLIGMEPVIQKKKSRN